MIDDAMSGTRLIGMIQTVGSAEGSDPAQLAKIGCAGRITSYSETDDGRYLISLTGICRFRWLRELPSGEPYRQVETDFSAYLSDLYDTPDSKMPDRDQLMTSLKGYTRRKTMEVDWEAVKNAPMETLVNALSSGCPFGMMEKQALLEAETVADRAMVLMALLDMDVPGDDPTTLQ